MRFTLHLRNNSIIYIRNLHITLFILNKFYIWICFLIFFPTTIYSCLNTFINLSINIRVRSRIDISFLVLRSRLNISNMLLRSGIDISDMLIRSALNISLMLSLEVILLRRNILLVSLISSSISYKIFNVLTKHGIISIFISEIIEMRIQYIIVPFSIRRIYILYSILCTKN